MIPWIYPTVVDSALGLSLWMSLVLSFDGGLTLVLGIAAMIGSLVAICLTGNLMPWLDSLAFAFPLCAYDVGSHDYDVSAVSFAAVL